jgi:hypothetical protein
VTVGTTTVRLDSLIRFLGSTCLTADDIGAHSKCLKSEHLEQHTNGWPSRTLSCSLDMFRVLPTVQRTQRARKFSETERRLACPSLRVVALRLRSTI